MKTLAAWRGCRNKECKSEKCEEGDNCKCTTENPCKHCKQVILKWYIVKIVATNLIAVFLYVEKKGTAEETFLVKQKFANNVDATIVTQKQIGDKNV